MASKRMDGDKLDRIVADARQGMDRRAAGYREKALQMYPWICGRCKREFDRSNVRELTVHHRDHDHDNNPEDGSNWELLCLYCHDNEHQRLLDARPGNGGAKTKDKGASHKAFADLKNMLDSNKSK